MSDLCCRSYFGVCRGSVTVSDLWCRMSVSHRSALQECQECVSSQSVLEECQVRVSQKKCEARVSYKSAK